MTTEQHKKDGESGENELGGVLITGGSSGIGAALITSIINHNGSIPVFNLSRTKPTENRLIHTFCDLADPKSIKNVLPIVNEWLESIQGPVLVINNSGFGRYGTFPRPNWEDLRDMIQVNLIAPLELTAALLPEIEKRGGGFMNICSTAAFQPTPFFSVYGATKTFLLHWSLSSYREYRKRGVHFLAVCPGPTSTRFFQAAGFTDDVTPPGGGMTSEQVAEQAWGGWTKKRSLVVNGKVNRLLAWLSGSLPRTWSASITESVMRRFRLDHLDQ